MDSDGRLSLVQALTEEFQSFAVWKNVSSALEGPGDIDALCVREERRQVRRFVRQYHQSSSQGRYALVVECLHFPQRTKVLLVEQKREMDLCVLEIDLTSHLRSRGVVLLTSSEALSLTHRRDGYRLLDPKVAEYVLQVIQRRANAPSPWAARQFIEEQVLGVTERRMGHSLPNPADMIALVNYTMRIAWRGQCSVGRLVFDQGRRPRATSLTELAAALKEPGHAIDLI